MLAARTSLRQSGPCFARALKAARDRAKRGCTIGYRAAVVHSEGAADDDKVARAPSIDTRYGTP